MSSNGIILRAENLRKNYSRGAEEVHALAGISMDIREGEYVSVTGPSGSGKTTLMNIIGCLDNPTSGRLTVADETIFDSGKPLGERRLTEIRRRYFGYIFQSFYLIPSLTVCENVMVPLMFTGLKKSRADIMTLLEKLGIASRADHLPGQISGGEMQRAAIARALANNPRILLADEPTGNLDSQRSLEISAILKELNRDEGITIMLISHNPELAATADRIIEVRDGRITGQ
jgi:putative ABC transport system ATP-binding protein